MNDLFKKIIILFWTAWWLIALWTDVVGALAHEKLLIATWAPDVNYPFLAESLKMYNAPIWLINILFSGILCWSFLSSAAFCWASIALTQPKTVWLHRAQMAFTISISFWFAFFLADQITMKFDLEQNHMVQGGFELLTLLALYILP